MGLLSSVYMTFKETILSFLLTPIVAVGFNCAYQADPQHPLKEQPKKNIAVIVDGSKYRFLDKENFDPLYVDAQTLDGQKKELGFMNFGSAKVLEKVNGIDTLVFELPNKFMDYEQQDGTEKTIKFYDDPRKLLRSINGNPYHWNGF
jgi:hypothetical protein